MNKMRYISGILLCIFMVQSADLHAAVQPQVDQLRLDLRQFAQDIFDADKAEGLLQRAKNLHGSTGSKKIKRQLSQDFQLLLQMLVDNYNPGLAPTAQEALDLADAMGINNASTQRLGQMLAAETAVASGRIGGRAEREEEAHKLGYRAAQHGRSVGMMVKKFEARIRKEQRDQQELVTEIVKRDIISQRDEEKLKEKLEEELVDAAEIDHDIAKDGFIVIPHEVEGRKQGIALPDPEGLVQSWQEQKVGGSIATYGGLGAIKTFKPKANKIAVEYRKAGKKIQKDLAPAETFMLRDILARRLFSIHPTVAKVLQNNEKIALTPLVLAGNVPTEQTKHRLFLLLNKIILKNFPSDLVGSLEQGAILLGLHSVSAGNTRVSPADLVQMNVIKSKVAHVDDAHVRLLLGLTGFGQLCIDLHNYAGIGRHNQDYQACISFLFDLFDPNDRQLKPAGMKQARTNIGRVRAFLKKLKTIFESAAPRREITSPFESEDEDEG